jgi:succinate dehydrogenase hydrophobic anchor subunit
MTDRWYDVTWRTFEVLVLVLALAHGSLALRSAVRGSSLASGPARVLEAGVYVLAGGFTLAVLLVAFRFH